MALSEIETKMKRFSLIAKGILGGFVITAVEFIFGFIFNIILKMKVWDYSNIPFNIKGQICPVFTFIWIILSMIFIPFSGLIKRKISSKE